MDDKDKTIDALADALENAAWFIENVNEDTPDKNDLFFETRESWRKAFRMLRNR